MLISLGTCAPTLATTDYSSTAPGQGAPDTLCDVWQALFNGWGLSPAGDEDKDGCTNFVESVAGTDPRVAGDCHRVGNTVISATNVIFTFDAEAGKKYRVLCDDSPGGAFTTVVEQTAPVSGQTQFIPTADAAEQTISVAKAAGSKKFYKLEVSDVDTDSDGVSDWAERETGTDPEQGTTLANASGGAANDGDTMRSLLSLSASVIQANGYEVVSKTAVTPVSAPAKIGLTRTWGTMPLTLPVNGRGGAPSATKSDALASDYHLPATVTIPAGGGVGTPVEISALPVQDANDEVPEYARIGVGLPGAPDATGASALVTFCESDPTRLENRRLYVAFLGREEGIVSTASGYATALVDGANNTASVSVVFNNLSSLQNTAYIRLGPDQDLVPLPTGQVSGATWNIRYEEGMLFTDQATLDALANGQLGVAITSADYPNREIFGYFNVANGSEEFDDTNPNLVPPLLGTTLWETPTGAALERDIWRFMNQATMGGTTALYSEIRAEVDAAMAGGGTYIQGLSNWLDKQMNPALTPSLNYRQLVMAADMEEFALRGNKPITYNNDPQQNGGTLSVTYVNGMPVANAGNPNTNDPGNNHPNSGPSAPNRRREWWTMITQSQDHVRQRVTQALSEICVISERDTGVLTWHYGAANWWDMLAAGAFGKYRDLLQNVTLSPMMGIYLSSIANRATYTSGGITISPDENYAREIMQLFSIGLVLRHPDGSLRLSPEGLPIATYDNNDITELARVFTGFSHGARAGTVRAGIYSNYGGVTTTDQRISPTAYANGSTNNVWFGRQDGHRYWQTPWLTPMVVIGRQSGTTYHDFGEKTLFAGKHAELSLSLTDISAMTDANTHAKALEEVVNAHDMLAGRSADPTYPEYEEVSDTRPGHTNTPINISRWLIQRLVTSNPSASYIYRVQKKYRETNGTLGAVVKAILLDYEARSLQLADGSVSHGKLKEPMIHFAHLLRQFRAYSGAPVSHLRDMQTGFSETDAPMSQYPASEYAKFATTNLNPPSKPAGWPDGPFRLRIDSLRNSLGQSPLDAPTVFNWFYPDFTVPGKMAQAGLFAPEMQTATEAAEVSKINFLYNYTWMNLAHMTAQPGVGVADFIFRNGWATPAVRFSTNGGSTLMGWPATIQLDASNWNTGITLTMVGVNNRQFSQMAYSGIRYAVSGSAPGYNGVSTLPTPVSFVENEGKNERLIVTETGSATWVRENAVAGADTDRLLIRLSTPLTPGASVNVSLTSANGEVTLTPNSLTFTDMDWSTAQTVTVAAVDDGDIEDAGAVDANDSILITTSSSTYEKYDALSTPAVPVNVCDNDGGMGVFISETIGTTAGTTGGSTDVAETGNTSVGQAGVDSYTIVLTSAPASNVVVNCAPSQLGINTSGTTFTTSATTRTFTPGNWNVAQTVVVRGNNDTTGEGWHWGRVSHSISSGGGYPASLPVAQVATHIQDDDDSIILTHTGGETRVMEGEMTDTIKVRLRTNPNAPVSVTLSAAQMSFNPSSIVFVPTGSAGTLWSQEVDVTVTANDDYLNEGINEGLRSDSPPVSASATATLTNGAVSATTVTNPGYGYVGIPSVTFSAPTNTTATGTVVMNAGTVQSVTITNGGTNYTAPPTVTFSAPSSGVTATGTAVLNASGAVQSVTITNAGSGYTSAATVTFGAPSAGVTATGFAKLTADGKLDSITITNPGARYSSAPTITLGGSPASVVVVRAYSQSAGSNYNGSAAPAFYATVLDNDDSRLVVTESGGSTIVSEDGTSDTYTLSLGRRPDVGTTTTVTLTPSTTGIQVSPAGPITFNETNWSVPVTITVTTTNDATAEPRGTATITHNITSTDATYDRVNSPVVVVTVDDNDPAFAVTQTNIFTQVKEGGGTGTGGTPSAQDTFTVGTNGRNPTATVTITLVPDGQVTVSPATLTFSSTDTATKTVTVTAVDDTASEGGTHSGWIGFNVASTDSYFNGGFIPPVKVHVTDNDSPGVSIVEGGGTTTTTEGGSTTDSFTVVLTKAPAGNVDIVVDGGTQSRLSTTSTVGALTNVTLNFTPANWSTAQTVWTLPVDDTLTELRHLAPITLALAGTTTAPEYAALPSQTVTHIITDNSGDNTAAANVVRITEAGGSTTTTENTTTDTFTVVLSQQPVAPVTVTFAGDSQVAVSPSVLTFVPGETGGGTYNVAQTVTVRAVDDSVIEPAILHWGQITATVASADPVFDGRAVSPVTSSVYDNDGPRVLLTQSGGSTIVNENGVTDTYTVSLTHAPAADVVVTATANAQLSLSPAALTFTTANWNVPQTLTVSAVNDTDVETASHNGLVTHSVTSADPLYQNTSVATLTAQVWDNDSAGIDITPVGGTDTVITEGGPSDSVLIKLNTAPPAGTSVTITLYPPAIFVPPPQIGKTAGYFANDQGGNNNRDNIVIDYTESILKYRQVFYSTLASLYSPAVIPSTLASSPTADDNVKIQKSHWAASKAVVDQMDLWFNGGSMKARHPVLVEPHATPPAPLPPVNPRQAIIEAIYAHSGATDLAATKRYEAEIIFNPKSPSTTTFANEVRDRVRWCAYLITVGAPGLISH